MYLIVSSRLLLPEYSAQQDLRTRSSVHFFDKPIGGKQ